MFNSLLLISHVLWLSVSYCLMLPFIAWYTPYYVDSLHLIEFEGQEMGYKSVAHLLMDELERKDQRRK